MVETSSFEAEYIASTTVAKKSIWLSSPLSEILELNPAPDFKIHIDNQGAISSSQSMSINSRNKHIDIRYHFVRDSVRKKQIKTIYFSTSDQLADMLKK